MKVPLTRVRSIPVRWGMIAVATVLGVGSAACDSTSVSVAAVSSIELVPDRIFVIEGERDTVAAIPREEGGRALFDRTIAWSVEDPQVAAVTEKGVVEGRSQGITVLRAESEGVAGTAEIEVLAPPSIRLTPDSVWFEAEAGLSRTYEDEVDVENAGAGSLDQLTVTIGKGGTEPTPWLEAELSEEVAPTRLRIRVTARDLDPGSYEAEVVVSSPAAADGPRAVTVRMEVTEPYPWRFDLLSDLSQDEE